MRILLALSAAIVLGIAIGAAAANWRIHAAYWDRESLADSPAPPRPERCDSSQAAPKLVIKDDKYDFGTMETGKEQSHEFLFTNEGAGTLVLGKSSSSCQCTVTEMERGELAPGESSKVTIQWKTREVTGPFRQTIKIATNDPEQPQARVIISGNVIVPVEVQPGELIFSRVTLGEPAEAEVRLLCHVPGTPLEILDSKMADQDTAGCFEVACEPVSKEQLGDSKAQSAVLLRVGVKPGLPQGAFQQTILLRTNLDAAPAVTVPIKGYVVSDILVSGAGWSSEQNLVDFGVVPRHTGATRQLTLVVRGPHAPQTRFKPLRVDPETLSIKLGATRPIGSGTTTQTPLFIEIPKGSQPSNHLGSEQGKLGVIILETTDPKVPQFRLQVRFAVEG